MPTPQRWALFSNCQTQGLANSLQMLAEDVRIEAVDVGRFAADLADRNAAMATTTTCWRATARSTSREPTSPGRAA